MRLEASDLTSLNFCFFICKMRIKVYRGKMNTEKKNRMDFHTPTQHHKDLGSCHYYPFLLSSHRVEHDSVTPWTAAFSPLAFTVSQSLLKFMSIELVMLSNHLIFCCPLLFLPSIFPSIKVLSNEWAFHIRWPKYWSFSFSTRIDFL